MTNLRILIQYFAPSGLQVFYSYVLALLITLYWCRSQIVELLTPAGATETIVTFQQMLKQAVDQVTKNDVVAFLSIASIWALIGAFILAILYETVNIFITIRNDIIISSEFTHAEENKKHLLQEAALKLSIGLGFLLCTWLAWIFLFPLWHGFIVHPAEDLFQGHNILKEILGILGLGATICLLWRWLLLSLPKFT